MLSLHLTSLGRRTLIDPGHVRSSVLGAIGEFPGKYTRDYLVSLKASRGIYGDPMYGELMDLLIDELIEEGLIEER